MRVALPLLVPAVVVCSVAAALPVQAQTVTSISPFLRSVPSGAPSPDALRLTLGEAISRALEHNLGLLTADQGRERAEGARWVSLSALLPNLNGRIAESRQVVNLDAFGFPLPAGIPSLVGPFNVFDARLTLQQSIFDLKTLNEARADRHRVAAAGYAYRSARDLVVLAAGDSYLRALEAAARSESAQARRRTAEALLSQTTDMKAAGLVAGIDLLRAQLEVSTARQRATAAAADAEKRKLQLARTIGLPPGQAFTIVDDLPTIARPTMTLDEALQRAQTSRSDYQAALERVRAAEAARAAALGESLPSVKLNADFGEIGKTLASAHTSYSIAGAVNVPIFQGRRSHGRLLEADADLRARKAEADDLRAAIDFEVRESFLDLKAATEQLGVATAARDLAAQQLTQARDRFAAGLASNIEVVQAQEAVSLASEQYITALYGSGSANAALARDLGNAEAAARSIIGGIR